MTDPLTELRNGLDNVPVAHDVKPVRYTHLDELDETIYYRAECSCGWHSKLRQGTMAKASAGKDASNHRRWDLPFTQKEIEELA